MRISGRQNTLSHQAGMSALWHDADYIPDRRIDVPTVEKGLEGEPLPSERHHNPDQTDPYARQDAAYDIAAQQMERGIKGMEFLHGKKEVPHVIENAEVTRTMAQRMDPAAPTVRLSLDHANVENRQIERRDEAAQAGPKVSNTGDIGARMDKVVKMVEGLVGGLVGAAATQAFDPTGVTQTMAVEAASVVKAGVTANLAVGMSQKMKEADQTTRQKAPDWAATARRIRDLDVDEPEEMTNSKAALAALFQDE